MEWVDVFSLTCTVSKIIPLNSQTGLNKLCRPCWSSMIRVFTVCHSICIFWKHYCIKNQTRVPFLGQLGSFCQMCFFFFFFLICLFFFCCFFFLFFFCFFFLFFFLVLFCFVLFFFRLCLFFFFFFFFGCLFFFCLIVCFSILRYEQISTV